VVFQGENQKSFLAWSAQNEEKLDSDRFLISELLFPSPILKTSDINYHKEIQVSKC
jgi:hypothetical protein